MPVPATESTANESRYSRQELFAPLGPAGQRALAGAHLAIIGVGATGAAVAALLARAGAGRLTLIDRDVVEDSNLQRQVLFDESDAAAGMPKAEAAKRKLVAANAAIRIDAHVADFGPENAHALVGGAGLLIDGTDNFETRYLINDVAVESGTAWIYTAALGARAAGMNVLPRSPEERPWQPTACLACLFPQSPAGDIETCDTAGILGSAVQLAASWAACEALKFLSGNAEAMRKTFLTEDLWSGERSQISAATPRNDCSVCAQRVFAALRGEARPHITLCGRNAVQIHERRRPVDLRALADRLRPLGAVAVNDLLLRFTSTPYTLTVFPDGRALVQGTVDRGLARSLYARYIGA